MNELTKLPDKWCIKRIKDVNFTEITKGMNKIYETSYTNSNFKFPWIAFDYKTPKINKSFSEKPSNCIEITFDQFKKWVLKETDSWCVEVTKENEEVVHNWYGLQKVSIGSVCGITNNYGIPKYGKGHNMYMSKYFDKLLTTEQFYEKIGHKVEKKPILPNSAIANKRVENLSYPDVVHIQCRDDHNKFGNRVVEYNENCKYYLININGGGKAVNRTEYENKEYTIYEMDQIIFPNTIVKPIEKWSVGSYVVFLEDYIGNNKYKKGEYQEIINFNRCRLDKGAIEYKDGNENDLKWEEKGKIKWFATKEEAEKFAATLVTPVEEVPKYVECIGLNEVKIKHWASNYTVGKIYKVKGKDFNDSYTVIFKKNNYRECDSSQFKPSTKEAYDKQEYLKRYVEAAKPLEWTPQVGEWVVCTKEFNKVWYNGRIWQIGKIERGLAYVIEKEKVLDQALSLNSMNFRKATQEEISSVVRQPEKIQELTKEQLLEKAKALYPIGTKFHSTGGTRNCVVENHNFRESYPIGDIECYDNIGDYMGTIYSKGLNKWAEIIEIPKSTPSQVMNIMEDIAKDLLPGNNNTGIMHQLPRNYYIRDTSQNISEEMKKTLLKLAHQLNNKTGKRFSPIKAELINIKKLKRK